MDEAISFREKPLAYEHSSLDEMCNRSKSASGYLATQLGRFLKVRINFRAKIRFRHKTMRSFEKLVTTGGIRFALIFKTRLYSPVIPLKFLFTTRRLFCFWNGSVRQRLWLSTVSGRIRCYDARFHDAANLS